MYGSLIRFAISKNIHQSTIRPTVYPSNFFSCMSTQPNHKRKPSLVDDIRDSASGLPPTRLSDADDHVNVVRTSATPGSTTSYRRENDDDNNGDMSGFVADTAKKGVAKAMETGLGIREMGKRTVDNMWDATKDTTEAVKEAVTGDKEKKDDVSTSDGLDHRMRNNAGWKDLERNQ